MKKLIIFIFLLSLSVATMANLNPVCSNGCKKDGSHNHETITVEPVIKHDVVLIGLNLPIPTYETITVEPIIKSNHAIINMDDVVYAYEAINVEPIVKTNQAIINMDDAIFAYEAISIEPVVKTNTAIIHLDTTGYVYEQIMVEPVIKLNVLSKEIISSPLYEVLYTDPMIKDNALFNAINPQTNKSNTLPDPNVTEEISTEPVVKNSKPLQLLIDAIDKSNDVIVETLSVEPVIKPTLYFSADTLKEKNVEAPEVIRPTNNTSSLLQTNPTAAADTAKEKNKAFSKDLENVVVTSKKPPFERKADKLIVNVDANITNSGATAMEVLEKTPGVSVDKDGNISMAGKNGVMVLIDGKQTFMTNADLADYLRNLPASGLDKLEVMTNPSAKYDASGNSGIINIVTKKQKQKGFNGSLSTSTGIAQYMFNNNSLNLNYRKNKWNLFSNISGNIRKSYDDLQLSRTFFKPDGTPEVIFDQKTENNRLRRGVNGRVGFDYLATKQTTFGMVFSGFYSPGTSESVNHSYLKNHANELDSTVISTNNEKRTWKNASVNVNFRHQFDSAGSGREISMDVDYLHYNRLQDQLFLNENFDLNGVKSGGNLLSGDLPSTINIMSAKADYSQNLFKKYKLDAGLKFSHVQTKNVADYFNIINNTPVQNDEITNSFDYEESIAAAYINVNRSIGKWSFQAGLRAEHTVYKGFQYDNAVQPDSSFKNDYTSLFPTFYATHKLNAKNNFTLSYGRRINRPDYASLNPFRFFLDQYTYAGGNPFLRPMYTNVLEVGHSYGRNLHTKLSYSKTNNLITQIFETEGFAAFVRPGNYGTQDVFNFNVTYMLKAKSFLNTTIYAEATHNKFDGIVSGNSFQQEGTTYLLHLNNQFTFRKGWSAELSGFYRTKGWDGQIDVEPVHMLNAGVQKKILKDKGTLKLALNNLLQYQVYTGNIKLTNAAATFRNNQFSRSAAITFTYRFGKPIKGLPSRKQSGNSEEQNRVKSS